MRKLSMTIFLSVFCSAVLAQVTVPNTFTPGTQIKASEMNDNFQALVAGINRGIPGYEIVQQSFTVPANTTIMSQFAVNCPAGKKVLTGGYLLQGLAYVSQNQPFVNSGNVYGWYVGVNNPQNPSTIQLFVSAICFSSPGQ